MKSTTIISKCIILLFVALSVKMMAQSMQVLLNDFFSLSTDVMRWNDVEYRNTLKEMAQFKINNKDVTLLSMNDLSCYEQIPELKTKKIVAIGETIHGTETMPKIAYQLFRNGILKNNCRLALLELPLEKMLLINRFVQGDNSLDIDTLINAQTLDIYSVDELKSFCLWLKTYNKEAKEKVWFLGADYCHSSIECIYLCDYLYSLYSTTNDATVLQLYQNVMDAVFTADYTDAFETFSNSYTLLEAAVGEIEAAIIKHCITTLDNMIKSTNNDVLQAQIARDSVMFVNTDFFYVPSSLFPKTFIQARQIGNRLADRQFTAISTNSEDGVLFVSKCEARIYFPEKMHDPVSTKTTGMLVKQFGIYNRMKESTAK